MVTTINPSDQTITQYNVQTGGANNLLNNVAPSSTSGVPVISQGASSQPVFGTAVVAGGGTGQVTLTNHGVLVGAGTSAITQLATGSSGQVLQSGGASGDPAYSTATYPATATSTGTILRADGTNWSATTATYPATTSASQLLYSSSANVVGGLTTANNGTLVTSNTGVPSILAGGTAGQVLQSVSGAAPAWSTPTYPSASGSAGTILRSDGTNNVYTTSTYPNTNAVNTLLYASSANVMGALATANSGVLATNSSGVPSIDTTNFAVLSTGVQLKGNNANTTPPAGFIGEVQTSAVGTGAQVSMAGSSLTATQITSISLTAGIWDISAVAACNLNGATVTVASLSINSSVANGTQGSTYVFFFPGVASVYDGCGSIPQFRVTLSTTTTYYLVMACTYSVATPKGYGRITATRVG